jgi:hypothetical protein
MRWDGVKHFDPAEMVRGLRGYIDGDDPIYPLEDKRYWQLHQFLYEQRPAPAGLLPLLGPRGEAAEVDGHILKRDSIAVAVVTTFERRVIENPEEPGRAELLDAIAYAGACFSFDPLYEDAPNATQTEVVDFFMHPKVMPSAETRASLEKNFGETLERWRNRVTETASTTFFGIVLRHMGPEGLDRLFGEWERMRENERTSLLRLAAEEEGLGRESRRRMVSALMDPSWEVREAAYDALKRLGAPLGELEITDREEELTKALVPLQRWADKTDS